MRKLNMTMDKSTPFKLVKNANGNKMTSLSKCLTINKKKGKRKLFSRITTEALSIQSVHQPLRTISRSNWIKNQRRYFGGVLLHLLTLFCTRKLIMICRCKKSRHAIAKYSKLLVIKISNSLFSSSKIKRKIKMICSKSWHWYLRIRR